MKKFGTFLKKHKKFFISALVIVLVVGTIAISLDLKEKHKWKKHPVAPYHYDFVENDDLATVRKRILETQMNAELDISKILEDVKEDGSFKSIDYDSQSKDNWPPLDHLKKVLDLQIAYYSKGNPHYQDPAVKKIVTKSMAHWVEKDYKCSWNWWYNDIGVGKYMPDILLFGVDGLSKETQSKLLSNIMGSHLKTEKVFNGAPSRPVDSSGGNLTDKILSTMKIAVVENDGNTMMWLTHLLDRELHPFLDYKPGMFRADCVGMKSDGSFQQHDQLIYFGGYGEVFADGVNQFLAFTKDTQYALPNEALNLYADFLLDSMQLFTRGDYREVNASGRGISRKNGLTGIHSQVEKGAKVLLTYDNITRAAELQEMLKTRFDSEIDAGARKNRYFYESDFAIMNNQNYMASVRSASKITRIYEYLNGENPFAYYTGMGATFFYVDGDEYYNVLPLYDWNKIPGTTTRQGFLPYHDEGFSYNTYGATDKINGCSDGQVGVNYMQLKDNGVSGKKAYFMFEDAMVCLGTDLKTNKKEPLLTCINQQNLKGNVLLNGTDALELGKSVNGKYDYVYHDDMAYFTDQEMEISAEHVDGDWKKINERFKTASPISGDKFTISIPHKEKNASYAYTVLMNTTPEEAKEYAASARYQVIANTKDVQAVFDTKAGILQAVFHKKGTLEYADGKVISANKPCVLMISTVNNEKTLTAVSYNRKPKNVKIRVDGKIMKAPLRKDSISIPLA